MYSVVDLVIGFVLGIASNILADLGMAYCQFQSSRTSLRVKRVRKATKEIVNGQEQDIGMLRNKYRYSLGVPVDVLAGGFDSDAFGDDGPWPGLLDDEGDRWCWFNQYVRPVIDDLNAYSFFRSGLFRLFRPLRQLRALLALCTQLEVVVSELDAALETKLVEWREEENQIWPKAESSQIEQLRNEYHKLHSLWRHWVSVSVGRKRV